MTEKRWTPGPWRVLDGKYGLQIHSERHWIASIKCESCPVHEVPNAHLIAAAPELYEAGVAALDSLAFAVAEIKAQAHIPDDDMVMMLERVSGLRKALAKARGGK